MNTTEEALIKKIRESAEHLMNFHNVPILVVVQQHQHLRTMGSRNLRMKWENEFKKDRDWEKSFKEDKKDMMNLTDNEYYTSGSLDKEAEHIGVSN